MKKYFLSLVAMAAAMLFATSCQESLVEPQVGGPTTFTIEIPGQMGTKADGDMYKLFVEVYSEDGSTSYHRIEAQDMAVGTATTVTLNLVANQNYDIIFWAQKNADSYGVDDLSTVQMNANHHNSETGAAFYAVLNNYNPTQGKKEVRLTRPFAQLNLYTTNDVAYGKVNLVKSTITIEGVAEKFNRVNQNGETFGEGVGRTTYEYTSNILPTGIKAIDGVEYQYVSMDYLAVPGNQNLVNVTAVIDVMDEKGNQSQITRIIEQVPVQMNYRTNIIGNLITSASDFKVEISEDWKVEDKTVEYREVSTATELHEAVAAGVEEIVLVADIELDRPLEFPAAPTRSQIARASTTEVPSSYVLDLNGKTINVGYQAGSTTNHIYAFQNYANLTIKGNGTINARGIDNYGVLTLENGTINAIDGNGGYAVINYDGSEFIMNGGTVATTNEDGDAPESGNIDATPIKVERGAKAVINGGTINNICNFTCVLENDGDVTINGGEFKSYWSAFLNYNAMTIKGGNVTVLAAESIDGSVHPIYAGENSITRIEGGSFNARTDKASCYSIAANNGNEASVSISGGTFSKTGGGKHFSGDKLTVEVTGGTFYYEPTSSILAEDYEAVLAADGESYVVLPKSEVGKYDIVISDPAQLTSDVIKNYSNIYLAAAGEYYANLYDIDYKETLTITGTEGVKFAHTAVKYGQLRIEQIQNFTIRNCEILPRQVGDRNWGMMVFSKGRPNGVYTIENCTFNSVGTQGIYINETNSSAVYHIKNCTFNGDFGGEDGEGAITISTHQGVNHTVNVKGCEFNNVPAEHRIFLTPSTAGLFYDFTLNTDLKAVTNDEVAMFIALCNEDIKLSAGTYTIDLYNIKYRDNLTITGTDGTKVEFADQQVVTYRFRNLLIQNCEILRMATKKWGMLVLAGNIDGVYTIKNCTFNGVGTNGIYINQDKSASPATYNIINCTFNGDFGTDLAVAIQNNQDVNHSVNVTNCTFNNSQGQVDDVKVFYNYPGLSLNIVGDGQVLWNQGPLQN